MTTTFLIIAAVESKYHYIENGFNEIMDSISNEFSYLYDDLDEEVNAHRTTKNGKGRTKKKHEKGLARKIKDMKAGEKGDAVRKPRKDPKKRKGLWILALLGLMVEDDEED